MGFGGFFKRIGKVAAAPILIPARATSQRVEKCAMNKILGSLIRHALTALGGAGVVTSDSDIQTIVSGIMVIAGIVHSIYEKRKQPAATE